MPATPEFVPWSVREALRTTFADLKLPKKSEGIRVVVGSGDVAPADWVCVDSREDYPVADPDRVAIALATKGGLKVRGDARSLDWIPTGSASIVYAHHVLEHVAIADWDATLVEWVRLLRPGGLLYLCQPDLAAVAARLLEGTEPGSARAWFEADPEVRTWPGDGPDPLLATGHGELSAWYWLYLGGDHRSVPTGKQIRSVLEPLGMEVRRARRRLADVDPAFRLFVSLEGCFVARKPLG